ncbi:hypothetical protein SDC9_189831 [bioreactor metagenome]|uniref:Uncharacterized protein n=1 Tax=bioreactor metagenome TaxID=1076179 RepID=A0A645I1E9_9ZZZZ
MQRKIRFLIRFFSSSPGVRPVGEWAKPHFRHSDSGERTEFCLAVITVEKGFAVPVAAFKIETMTFSAPDPEKNAGLFIGNFQRRLPIEQQVLVAFELSDAVVQYDVSLCLFFDSAIFRIPSRKRPFGLCLRQCTDGKQDQREPNFLQIHIRLLPCFSGVDASNV